MYPISTYHEAFLEFVSEGMIHRSRREQFMEWIASYLVRYIKPSHVSIALYDPARDAYPVEVSSGPGRIPSRLVALDRENTLVQWFQQDPSTPSFVRRSKRLVSSEDLKNDRNPSIPLLDDMRRHHAEVCVKIETRDRLTGYLLIGPREDGIVYTQEDLMLFQVMANNLAVEIEKEEYYQLSHVDPLTGSFNRQSLDAKFQALLEKTKASGGEFAVAMVDLDDFKKINDGYGHLVGDQVLRTAGEIFRKNLRQSDMVFRYGGEEFLLILTMNSRNPGRVIESRDFHVETYQVLERLRKMIESRPFICGTHEVPVTVSMGLTFFAGEMLKGETELIEEADQALYASKRSGKNVISEYPYL